MKRKIVCFCMIATMLSACGQSKIQESEVVEAQTQETEANETEEQEVEEARDKPTVTIIYTNDIHSNINNQAKNDAGEVMDLLNYAKVAAMKNDLIEQGETVFLVDGGDFSQGTAYGAFDEGESMIQLMNLAGYDVSAVGNHEFDYGMLRAMSILTTPDFPVISCNFIELATGEAVLPGSVILERNGAKVAFVGISTPATILSSAPTYFQDAEGNFLYTFLLDDLPGFYACVQKEIDAVKEQADYVVAVGHCGVEEGYEGMQSIDVIENTTGIDAFIDGHSHTVMEGEIISNKEGEPVVLTQTGCYLSNIGVMHLSSEGIKTELVDTYDNASEEVNVLNQQVVNTVQDKLGEVIATLESPLYINDPDNPDVRLVRNQNTNLSDLTADAVYWYFNEYVDMECDIVLVNGGGIRNQIEAGEFTYLSAKSIQPFGNIVCLIKVDGQTIKDVLELGATLAPEENGSFMKPAGLHYTIDTTVASTIQMDSDMNYIGPPTGEYRVKDITVYDKRTGSYEPLDLERTYTLGGINYFLRNGGCGMSMLMDAEVIVDYVNEDYLVLAEYVKAFTGSVINNANAPLAQYQNYMYDYENPYGSGRIWIE